MNPSTSTKSTLDERLSASQKALETKFVFPATLGVIVVLIVIWIGSKIFAADIDGYWVNIFTDGVSIAITILVLDRLNGYRYTRERKLALFRQAKSRSNDVAVEALDQILHEGWWDDLIKHYTGAAGQINLRSIQWAGGIKLGSVNLEQALLLQANLEEALLANANLRNAELVGANLKNIFLLGANLEKADMRNTNLQQASLGCTNLKQANLWDANLKDTYLGTANLQEANLRNANLQHANLFRTNLRGTNLVKANLKYAVIEATLFDELTVLPDATEIARNDGMPIYDKYWTRNTDMRRYTDPDYRDRDGKPDFWEPGSWKPEYWER